MIEELWNASAETYRADAENISFYRDTNVHLVDAARIRPGMKVVDIACGAGLTTRGILACLRGEGAVYSFDRSEGMVREASQVVKSPLARFAHASADEFAQHVPELVDRVLCNSAFWLFPDHAAVLRGVRAVLRPDGLFLFNIPDQAFDFGDGRRSELRLLVDDCLGLPADWGRLRYSRESIAAMAAACAFRLEEFQILEIPVGVEDLLRFYAIEQIAAWRLPQHTPEERRRMFEEAFRRLPPHTSVTYRWAQITLALA